MSPAFGPRTCYVAVEPGGEMVNLFDITRQAGSGTGLDLLSRQFGLDTGQTERTVEALLPAFSLAFQRSALDPSSFADVIGAIGSGRYGSFYDASGPGRPAASAPGSDTMIEQLFRNPDATRRVAEQAAAAAGVGVQVVQRMMPVLAATLIGGLFRSASVEGFSDLLRQWSDALKATSGSGPARPAPAGDPWTAWTAAASAMMGAPARTAPASAPSHPVEAWTAAMAAMLGGAKAPPPKEPSPFEVLSRMFETGREVQAQHLAGLRSILDAAWGSPGPKA